VKALIEAETIGNDVFRNTASPGAP
jgi:hypothetical protein